MRVQGDPEPDRNGVFYLLGDHLGSTNVTADSSGNKVSELRYMPWGKLRDVWGATPTNYRFTGQREVFNIGLYYYGARWYDAALGRFVQADTIVPDASLPQSWNRYAYSLDNPLRYIDPTGHSPSPRKTEKESTRQKRKRVGLDGPTPPATPTPSPFNPTQSAALTQVAAPPPLVPIISPTQTPYLRYEPYTSTATLTPTVTPKPVTWKDVESIFDSIAAPDFRPDFSEILPAPTSTILRPIEDGLAILWSIKEIFKSPIFNPSAYYQPYRYTPTPYMRTPTPSPTPRFRPTRTPTPTRIPYRQ